VNPIQLTHTLQNALVDYLTTIFDVNRNGQEPELAASIEQAISVPGALFNGPYLEIAPPYEVGDSLEALCDQGVLTPKLRMLPCFKRNRPLPLTAPLYRHQEKAIRKLCADKRSVVVSSGTGSGKTECFLIPILNDLLLDPSPGVRAVLIYPLNALVNDQLDRLRVLLKGTNINFGRYTSELANTTKEALRGLEDDPLPNEVISREEIRSGEKLPQILITNYAMLEYLLLRPEDSILFKGGRWRFIVLDEAHSYSGAQGIEVAMLIRRLKHRLNKVQGEVRCVATSATLTNDNAQTAVDFASTLFDEVFEPDDIIFGQVNEQFVPHAPTGYSVPPTNYLHADFPELLKRLRGETSTPLLDIAVQLSEMGLVPDNILDLSQETPQTLLYHSLLGNQTLSQLRSWMMERRDNPAHVREAAEQVFGELDSDARQQALYRLIELGAMARPGEDQPSLLPTRYHLFARPPQGIWVCLNPQCEGRTTSEDAGWSRMFSERRETCDSCGCRVYPIVVCRECGQVYVRMLDEERRFVSPPDELYGDETLRYFTWKPVRENRGLGALEDEVEPTTAEDKNAQFKQEEKMICLRCGYFAVRCTCENDAAHVHLHLVHQIEKDGKHGTRATPTERMNKCCRCYSKSMEGTEIVTTISVGGVTPLSVLTYELYRELPTSTDELAREKPGDGRKLLTFYDNRQGAARFAAFLQDIVNTQNYRHILVQAVREHQAEEGYLPSIDSAARRSVKLAWEKRIFHNDPDTEVWRDNTQRMTGEQRESLKSRVMLRLLAEFTTGRDERQSLEKLGVIGVSYFEDDQLPDFAPLSDQIGLSPDATKALIEYLLDDVRKRKIITLPRGVEADDPIFGRNVSHNALVRKQSGGSKEESWTGSTARHYRRRLVAHMLRHFKRPTSDQAIDTVLTAIWEWLIDENTALFKSVGSGGYQLKHDHIFFHTDMDWYRCARCQRLYCRGDALPCPHPDCGGQLELYDVSERQEENYFYGTYQRRVIPMRVEEHTAQLDSEKGRNYQDGFRDGSINVLSCSTTFEMGIDLGDLQAVVMNNVPPTVANYRQRSGRAGRRTSGTAFILTWASERPHDQNYFRNPPEIIRGHVRVPYIALDNPFIRQRHINAVLLSSYLRYRSDAGHGELGQVGGFFDAQGNGGEPHYVGLDTWLKLRHGEIRALIEAIAPSLAPTADIVTWMDAFKSDMAKVNENYQTVTAYYREQIERLRISTDFTNASASKDAIAEIQHFNKLLDRLQKDFLINHLSGRGVLPSYSFPLYTVEMQLPANIRDSEHLRLERDLRQAIREYAPGSEVVADKRIWRSGGLQFYRDTVRDREYRICPTCNNLHIANADGIPLTDGDQGCPVCHEKAARLMRFVTPDGFRADRRKSGIPARQYVQIVPSKMRSGLLPASVPAEQLQGNMVYSAYERTGQLLYVNEGSGRGFRTCLGCGALVPYKEKRCKTKDCPGAPLSEVALGHVQGTDTLHLRFVGQADFPIPAPTDSSFWLSLMTALIHGASRALQIERRDIDGVLTPRARSAYQWEQTIVLYDNVPGGAGHVKQIQQELPNVLREALRVANCTDCAPDTSCYHCLRDYNNQIYHSQLRRGAVVRFLEVLLRDFETVSQPTAGAGQVIAANLPHWLMRQLEASQQQVVLAANSITLETPLAVGRHWLDLLHDLIQRKVAVDLYLERLPQENAAEYSIARHLQVLMERGLRLWKIDALPDWQVVIDPKLADTRRAIALTMQGSFDLGAMSGTAGLLTTIHPQGADAGMQAIADARAKSVNVRQLDPPENTQVINIRLNERITERALFGTVFARPVKRMLVNDPYLYDHERIVHRLGAYMELAAQSGALEHVQVITKRAGQSGNPGYGADQDRAEAELNRAFGSVVTFKHSQPQHDRFIDIERVDGSRAKIIIGQGLDFIQPDGRAKQTYVVIQDLL